MDQRPDPPGSHILEARTVSKVYGRPARRGGESRVVHALDEVSAVVRAHETLGIIGESGSGKTTLTRLLLGLEPPTAGSVTFEGRPLGELDGSARRRYRRAVAAVFQSPYSSLNPRMRIRDIVTEQLAIEGRSRTERRARAAELLDLVGFPAEVGDRYPHQLSGGQRQRIAIARALALQPQVIVLDEPLSALDVSIRAQIVNLLLELQERLGLAYVFVGHDLAIADHMCHRVMVLYRGRVVEEGPAEVILRSPSHPYTSALLEASYLDGLSALEDRSMGAVPDEPSIHRGCAYRHRCVRASKPCEMDAPELLGSPLHRARCHFPINPLPADDVQAATVLSQSGGNHV